jgi:hypothetical protein
MVSLNIHEMFTLEKLREQLPEKAMLQGGRLWAVKGGNSDKRGSRPGDCPPPDTATTDTVNDGTKKNA